MSSFEELMRNLRRNRYTSSYNRGSKYNRRPKYNKISNNNINNTINILEKNNKPPMQSQIQNNNSKKNTQCQIDIDQYKKQIFDATNGIIHAYTNLDATSRDRLHELRGITKNYKNILDNLLSSKCNVKRIFIPNEDIIKNLTKTVSILLKFIDKLMLDSGLSFTSFDRKNVSNQLKKLKKERQNLKEKLENTENELRRERRRNYRR